MLDARITTLNFAILLILAQPARASDNGPTNQKLGKDGNVLKGSVQHQESNLQGTGITNTITGSKGLNVVQESDDGSTQGLGMLGIYALCASDAAGPYYITNVFPSSKLMQCGVQPGDFLLRINDKSPFDYIHTEHPTAPGTSTTVTIRHEDTTRTVSVKLSDIRTFAPFLRSYSQWAQGHILFLNEHRSNYNGCALM